MFSSSLYEQHLDVKFTVIISIDYKSVSAGKGITRVVIGFEPIVQALSVTMTALGNRKKCHCKRLSLSDDSQY